MTAPLSSDQNALSRVLTALDRASCPTRGNGHQWQSRCPAHEDRNPSLSITAGTDRVLVKCHTGCHIDDILAALHLVPADLFDEERRPDKTPLSIVATYDYHDEDGTLLYQVCRMEPKTFRQRRPTGIDKWEWRLGETRRVLYRLPQLREAIDRGDTIHVVEGEKDVHAVERAGGAATCNPGGAGKWRPEYTQQLAGAVVIVVPDLDEPNPTHPEKGYVGQRHAEAVAAALSGVAATVSLAQPASGKDAADHIASGHSLDQLAPYVSPLRRLDTPPAPVDEPSDDDEPRPARQIRLTPASAIRVRPVHWVWDGRLALGTLGLLAGPEGVGKSTLGYWLAARITRGELPGVYQDQPRGVLVAATEDSWEHTIVPRLMAARADLNRVYRVDVITDDDLTVSLSMPRDLSQVEKSARDIGAALMLLDPLVSRLDTKLDTYKDAEVRLALEPLVAIADRVRMSIIGLIHHNKSGSSDPLTLVMASKGFTGVARSVHTVIRDPDDETQSRRLFGTPKNNLGRLDLPTLAYTITGAHIADTEEGPVWTGKLTWTGEVDGTITEALGRSVRTDEERTAVTEAADWLSDYVEMSGGAVNSADAKKEGLKAGHLDHNVKRARARLKLEVESVGMPRKTVWKLPKPDNAGGGWLVGTPPPTPVPTVPTGKSVPTVQWEQQGPVGTTKSQLEQSEQPPAREFPLSEPLTPLFDPVDYLCDVCGHDIDPTVDGSTHDRCDPWRTA